MKSRFGFRARSAVYVPEHLWDDAFWQEMVQRKPAVSMEKVRKNGNNRQARW